MDLARHIAEKAAASAIRNIIIIAVVIAVIYARPIRASRVHLLMSKATVCLAPVRVCLIWRPNSQSATCCAAAAAGAGFCLAAAAVQTTPLVLMGRHGPTWSGILMRTLIRAGRKPVGSSRNAKQATNRNVCAVINSDGPKQGRSSIIVPLPRCC